MDMRLYKLTGCLTASDISQSFFGMGVVADDQPSLSSRGREARNEGRFHWGHWATYDRGLRAEDVVRERDGYPLGAGRLRGCVSGRLSQASAMGETYKGRVIHRLRVPRQAPEPEHTSVSC